MRVLITGGTGSVGKAVVERFVDQGWDVRVIGLEEEPQISEAVEYSICNILDYPDLRNRVRGCQAVVHLAAIASPRPVSGPELFQINVAGTFNVFEAAAAEGVRRLAQASSINAFGCFWGNTDIAPQYLPIDEAHPTFTTDPYSFSKGLVEEIGDYYWRRDGISSVAFRFPGVWSRARITSDEVRHRRLEVRALIDTFAAQPKAEQQARLADIRRATIDYRQQRLLEFPAAKERPTWEGSSDDPLWSQYAFDRFNFWAYVDERDSAQALEKGITANYEGSHALFINAQHNWLDYDSRTLARLFFPEISANNISLDGSEALVSIAKARTLIGFEPEYSI